MIELIIENFRGCAHAHIEVAPIALVCGLNAAGKSSVAQAVAAALTGETMPFTGVGKASSGFLVRTGAAAGAVLLTGPDGQCRVEWPSAQMMAKGSPPKASPYAAGIESIVNGTARDRIRVLSNKLHGEPTAENLTAALTEAGAGPKTAQDICQQVERDGWDTTHKARQEHGAQLKGRWRQTTGANYGSWIAAAWRPDLAELSEQTLIADVREAQAERDHAVAAAAVSAAEKARLEKIAGDFGERKAEVERCEQQVSAHAAEYTRALEARSKLPPAARSQTKRCPHCNLLVEIVAITSHDSELHAVDEVTNGDMEKRRMAIAEAEGKTAHANDELNKCRNILAHAKVELAEAIAASATLADWPRTTEAGIDRDAAEAALGRAQRRLDEFRTKIEADKIAGRIEGNEIILGILAPDGLRARKLGQVLRVFNDGLYQLTAAAEWGKVAVDDTGLVTYGGRPYALLSSSEQFRTRTILAIEMARYDGSDMVVIDGADILDAPGRNGLFALLDDPTMPAALVCMTFARREQVPDLGGMNVGGKSYWLNGGVIEPVAALAAA
jgi:hypothetical protein